MGRSSSSTSNHVFMHLAFCIGAQSYWNRKGPSPNCSHKGGSIALFKMSWYAEALSFSITGCKGPCPSPEKQPHTTYPSFAKLNIWHNVVKRGTFSLHTPNPDSPIRLPNRETCFSTSQNMFPLLQSPVTACFTPLHPYLSPLSSLPADRSWKPIP